MKRQHRFTWKWGVGALAAVAVIAGLAALIAHSVQQSKNRLPAVATAAARDADWGSRSFNAAARELELVQLPAPGSPAADTLLSSNDTPTWVSELYTYHRDSASITPNITAEWLQLLQLQLQQGVTLRSDNNNTSNNSNNTDKQLEVDLQPFIRVAADILAYLRFSHSVVLLSLLREYATSNLITVEAVDPDALQAEFQQKFNMQNLNSYYVAMAQVDSTQAAASPQHAAAVSLARSKGTTAIRGRMLHESFQKRQQPQHHQEQQRHQRLLLPNQDDQHFAQHTDLFSQLLTVMTGGQAETTATTTEAGVTQDRSGGRRSGFLSTPSSSSSSSSSNISISSTNSSSNNNNSNSSSNNNHNTNDGTGTTDAGLSDRLENTLNPPNTTDTAADSEATGSGNNTTSILVAGLSDSPAHTLEPANTNATSADEDAASRSSGVQTLLDMICLAAPWTPPESLASVLPSGTACPALAPLQLYQRGELTFKPVTVPVVFHVLRFLVDIPALSFMSTDMPQAPMGSVSSTVAFPPIWDNSSSNSSGNGGDAAGQRLVDAVNMLFQNTGVQFIVQEVRTDVAQYPYLLQKDKSAWLNCSHNAAATTEGLSCLQGIARVPDVAGLASEELVINVIVSGSDGMTDYTYCSRTAADPDPLCSTTSRGYTAARGPWFLGSSDPAWHEDISDVNWLFMSWDDFDTSNLNRGTWNGGGATLAHELGHFLGLMHTHHGSPACINGSDTGDAVADTPPNQGIEAYAGGEEVAMLAGWCSDFRNGKGHASSVLSALQSCPGFQDNVFNTMAYLPDQCSMIFSPGQVERMQWAIAAHRPKLMAAHSSY